MKKLFGFCFMLLCGFVFSQTVPFGVNKKKYPLGEEFEKLLPLKLGKWTRYSYHDFVPGQETGKVFYLLNDDQVFLTFGKAYSQSGLEATWTRIYLDATDGKESQVKQKNTTSSSTKYLLMNGKSGFYYAWTRNLYYFTIETKTKVIADSFMGVFPY